MHVRRSLLALLAAAGLVLGALPVAHADDTIARYLVLLRTGVSASTVIPELLGPDATVLDGPIGGGVVEMTATKAAVVEASPYVSSVRIDAKVTSHTATTTGVRYSAAAASTVPWDLDILDSATSSQDGGYTPLNGGSGVTVYVMDTGINRSHSQFAGVSIAQGHDYVDGDNDPSDCDGQGTAVSSLIGGNTLGVSRGITMVPLRVLDCSGSGYVSNLVAALNYVLNDHLAKGTPAVAVIGLGSDIVDSLDAAVQSVIDAGVTTVVAADFQDADACNSSPGRVADAITVAASTASYTEATNTSYGSCVDLYAPGQDVSVADLGNPSSIITGSGTAYAAGLTAGVAAQILHAHPTWTPAQVSSQLLTMATNGKISGARSANELLSLGGPGVASRPGALHSLEPNRLVDTRTSGGKFASGESRTFQVTGLAGVPASGVSGVVLNVTATDTTSGGYLTVYPSDQSRPTASNLNWSDLAATIPNAVTVKVSAAGQITVFHSGPGTVQVIIDVAGYYTSGTVTDPGGFTSLTPSRILDTRTNGGAIASNTTRTLTVTGKGGVPSSGVSAVVLNVTVTQTTAGGYLTVSPTGSTRPTASNLNWSDSAVTVPNAVVVKLGTSGQLDLYQSGPGTAQVIVDVAGYYLSGSVTSPGMYVAVSPSRILDTRTSSAVAAGKDVVVQALGASGVPTSGVGAVVMNTTVTQTLAPGFLSVYPGSSQLPTASNVNWWRSGTTIPNLVTTRVGTDGSVSFHNGSSRTVQVIGDVAGYYLTS